ncbi:MAG: hypothetical protein J6K58_06780 [Lachnospiraceae bacterium]|nr:hypothetical protein [Lachnospiraceae bacterium]MBP3458896.1 hypothetical protein [Lachnospiraceae bacterium]
MNKDIKISIIMIVMIIVMIGGFVHWRVNSQKIQEQQTAIAQIVQITPKTHQQENVSPQETVSVTHKKETAASTPENINEEAFFSTMKIKKLNKEVLKLMGVNKKRLAAEIRIFANECGYANEQEAVYYGETFINHIEHTVSAAFYFMQETRTYKFNVIYNRKEDTFQFEAW